MNEVRNIVIGFELGEKFSQYCYYDRKAQDAISIAMKVGTSEYEFPTKLCKKIGEDEWKFGLEANYFSTLTDWTMVDDIYQLCQEDREIEVDGVLWKPYELMGKFFVESLQMLGINEPLKQISAFMVTVKSLDRNFVKNLKAACVYAGFTKGHYFIQNFDESFYYHSFYQRAEVWNRNVALFYFYDGKVSYEDLMVDAKPRPMRVVMKKGKTLQLSEDSKEKDSQFATLIQESFDSQIYSSVFLVGDEFNKEWAIRSVPLLCKGQRRVFHGNNLFAKGACFGAKEKTEEQTLRGYLYEGQDMVQLNVGMEMTIQGANSYYPFVVGGTNWYEISKEIEIILDDTKELIFSVGKLESSQKNFYSMKLFDLPERPNRTTRLLVRVEFESLHTCVITAKDLGFGEMYPSIGKVWTETLEI